MPLAKQQALQDAPADSPFVGLEDGVEAATGDCEADEVVSALAFAVRAERWRAVMEAGFEEDLDEEFGWEVVDSSHGVVMERKAGWASDEVQDLNTSPSLRFAFEREGNAWMVSISGLT